MSDLQTWLQRAADEAARHGRTPGPEAVTRRGRQRRRRLIGGAASLVVLVLLAVALGTGGLASRQTPLAPAPTATTTPTTTSVTRVPAAVKKVIPLDVQVHLGPSAFPDRFGMASDLTSQMETCEGGMGPGPHVAQVLGQTWALAAKEPLQGKNWICWSDGLWDKGGGALFGGHGGSKNQLKLLQASQLSQTIRGKGELAVVGGPRQQTSGPAADPVPEWTPDRPRAPGGRTAVPRQVLRRVLPPTGNDGLDARTHGRLRQGWPPNRGVLGNHRRGQRL